MGKFWVKYPLVNEDMSLNFPRILLLVALAGGWAAVCIVGMSKMGWTAIGENYSAATLLVLLSAAIAVLGGLFGSLRKSN